MSEVNYKEKYEELKKEYDQLYDLCERMLDGIRHRNTKLKQYELMLEEHNKHNARGAGRKPKFSKADIIGMKKFYEHGKSTREIAKIYNCSHVTVNKLINEQKETLKK